MNLREVLGRLMSESLVYGLGQAGGRLVQLLLVPILTRAFAPAEFGVVELVMLVFAVSSLFVVSGMDAALARFFYERTDRADKRAMATTSALHRATTGLVLGGALIAFAPAVAGVVLGSPDYAKYVRIAGATLPFSGIFLFANEALRVTFQPWKYILLNSLEMILVGLLSIWFVVERGYSVAGVLYARLFADAAAAACGLVLLRHTLSWRGSWADLREMLRYGAPLIPVALAYSVLTYADRQVLLHFGSLEAVGVYSVAAKLAAPVLLGVMAFQLAWGPMAFAQAAHAEVGRLYAWVLSLYALAGSTLALGVALLAPELLALFVPEAYRGAAAAGGLLAFAAVAHGGYYIAALGVNLEKQNGWLVLTTGLAALVSVTLGLGIVGRFGGAGVAAATLTGFTLSTVTLYAVSQRLRPFPYRGARALAVFLGALALAAARPAAPAFLDPLGTRLAILLVYPLAAAAFLVSGMQRPARAGVRPDGSQRRGGQG